MSFSKLISMSMHLLLCVWSVLEGIIIIIIIIII